MSEQSKRANEKRSQFWKNHLKEWSQQTGLTQNAYCRNNNLRPNQFTYWKNKFKNQNLPIEFVQITSHHLEKAISCHSPNILRLNINSGFQVEIPDGFSQATLGQVLQVVLYKGIRGSDPDKRLVLQNILPELGPEKALG